MVNIILCCLLSISVYSQSNVDKLIRGGEILVTGLAVLKERNNAGDTKTTIGKVCVKNKLTEKITMSFLGKDAGENSISRTLVIPIDGKECVLELPKGIYTYEIMLSNKEIFKRGDYRFDESMTITVKMP